MLLNVAEREKRIRGVKITQGSPIINHLYFVDDSLLFCGAKKKE